MVKETEVELDGLPGANWHVDSLGRPEQLYDTGSAVDVLVPLVTINEGVLVLVTVRFTPEVVPPWATDSVAAPRLEFSEKLSVVAVMVRLTVVVLETAPLVPFTVTATLLAAATFAKV